MRIENLQNENRKYAKSIGNFHVLEYVQDASVSPMNAMNEYFMSKMNVRRRQVVIDIDKDHSAIIQAGAMQWMGGNVRATSGVKGIGDFLGKAIKGAVTKETAVKPEYVGEGCLVLEPTYKYIILADVGLSLIHISEPTRRTPISYAVFCLKKKKNNLSLIHISEPPSLTQMSYPL